MTIRLALLAVVGLGAISSLVIACGDDDGGETPGPSPTGAATATASPAPATPTATASPTRVPPTPTATTPPTAAGPTGIVELDRTMLTVATREIGAILARVTLTEIACAAEVQGMGAPPKCESGEADKTLVKVFPWSTCEGQYAREPQVREILESALQPLVLSPMTVVNIEGVAKLGYQEGDRYGLIYTDSRPGAGAVMLAVNANGQITRLYRGCTASADELIERAGGRSAVIFPKGG